MAVSQGSQIRATAPLPTAQRQHQGLTTFQEKPRFTDLFLDSTLISLPTGLLSESWVSVPRAREPKGVGKRLELSH